LACGTDPANAAEALSSRASETIVDIASEPICFCPITFPPHPKVFPET
jgi:hypothetical protein